MKGDVTMLHDFMHIMAYIAIHPEERECLSCYLYRKQHEDVNFQTDFRKNEDNIDIKCTQSQGQIEIQIKR